MAANSKREQIINKVVAEMGEVSTIASVLRRVPSREELGNFALPQLPVCAIVGGLPVPVPHPVGRRSAGKDIFLSNLTVSLFVYFQDNVTPDTTLSSLLDDIWVKLYADETKGGLAINTTLTPTVSHDFWDPFYAFKLDAVIQYSHSKGGI